MNRELQRKLARLRARAAEPLRTMEEKTRDLREKAQDLREKARDLGEIVARDAGLREKDPEPAPDIEPLAHRRKALHPLRPLPEPAPLSMPLAEALKLRRSARIFSEETVPDDMLCAVLSACDGVNRRDGRRTTPSAADWQEVSVYVVKANGIWRWLPDRRALEFVLEHDRRRDFTLWQPFVTGAPVHLVYVVDRARMRSRLTDLVLCAARRIDPETAARLEGPAAEDASLIDVGCKVQAAYLACAALGLSCLARMSFDAVKAATALRLPATARPVIVQTVSPPVGGLPRRS